MTLKYSLGLGLGGVAQLGLKNWVSLVLSIFLLLTSKFGE